MAETDEAARGVAARLREEVSVIAVDVIVFLNGCLRKAAGAVWMLNL